MHNVRTGILAITVMRTGRTAVTLPFVCLSIVPSNLSRVTFLVCDGTFNYKHDLSEKNASAWPHSCKNLQKEVVLSQLPKEIVGEGLRTWIKQFQVSI